MICRAETRSRTTGLSYFLVFFFFAAAGFFLAVVFLAVVFFVTFVTAATDSFFFVSLPLKMFSQPEANFLFEPVFKMVITCK
jgi:hypothetical protein